MNNPIKQIPLDALFNSGSAGFSGSDFSLVTGFHVYGDLSLNLPLSAAEDDKNAIRFLNILQDYASIADVCASKVGAHLLEIHGERVHLLIPAENLSAESFKKLFAFCISFTKTVYEQIKPKAGDNWDGFAMAADHGPAVLLTSDCGGGSMVSLGNAANRPAKRLGRTPAVKSGHCAIRRELLGRYLPVAEKTDWVEIDVLDPKDVYLTYADSNLSSSMQSLAKAALANRRAYDRIAFADVALFNDPATSKVNAPTRVRGICLRADLDGFTKQVEKAFSEGPHAVLQLVTKFREIMKYPRQFTATMKRPCIEMPWAGDCSPLILMTRAAEKMSDVRKYLPATSATFWHEQQGLENAGKVKWGTYLGEAKWAVGVACGDEDEGSDGVILVANLETSGRKFRVAAGWSVRRARDAQEADLVKAEDTVIPKTDHENLDFIYQKPFREHDSRFMISTFKDLKSAQDDDQKALRRPPSVHVAGVSMGIPSAKPFSHDYRRLF